MANSYTLTQLANLCDNSIRLIGILTEFAADSYVKNDVAVIKYKGVVRCNNAFINIRATTTSFDDTFRPFVNEFNTDVVGKKVFIIGRLNNKGGVNVDYIAMAYKPIFFEGRLKGIPYDDHKFLVVDNDYHNILSIDIEHGKYQDYLVECMLQINPLQIEDNVIIGDGYPTIIVNSYNCLTEIGNASTIVPQAIEEHDIYIEAMQQIREGR